MSLITLENVNVKNNESLCSNLDFKTLSDTTLFDLYYNQNSPLIREIALKLMNERNLFYEYEDEDSEVYISCCQRP